MYAILVLLSLALALSTGARAATITIVEEHISIDAPSGWSVERNSTSSGLVYDLYMEGPSTGTGIIPPMAMLDGSAWLGAVNSGTLYAEMEREIEDIESDPDMTGLVFVSPPANTTAGGQKANDCTLRVTVSGLGTTMRLIIMASDAWNRVWKLGLLDDTADWASSQSSFNLMINSITVEEKEEADIGPILIVGAVIAIVVIIAVAVLLLRRKKEPAPVPIVPPPPFEQPPQSPPPPPPP
jgi:hypothetical protein